MHTLTILTGILRIPFIETNLFKRKIIMNYRSWHESKEKCQRVSIFFVQEYLRACVSVQTQWHVWIVLRNQITPFWMKYHQQWLKLFETVLRRHTFNNQNIVHFLLVSLIRLEKSILNVKMNRVNYGPEIWKLNTFLQKNIPFSIE